VTEGEQKRKHRYGMDRKGEMGGVNMSMMAKGLMLYRLFWEDRETVGAL
jgi:hypothetical protein